MLLITGFLFVVLIFVFVNLFSHLSWTLFLDLPSFLLIFIPLLYFLFVSKSGLIIGRYFKTSFKKGYVYTKQELESLSLAIKNTIKLILSAGWFGAAAFSIVLLGHIGAPERFGPSLIICLLSLTYSVAISFFIFFPVQAWADNKLSFMEKESGCSII